MKTIKKIERPGEVPLRRGGSVRLSVNYNKFIIHMDRKMGFEELYSFIVALRKIYDKAFHTPNTFTPPSSSNIHKRKGRAAYEYKLNGRCMMEGFDFE